MPLTRESVFLRLVAHLQANNIACCVVGDVRNVPEEIPSDVDIVVAPDALPQLPELLSRFCKEHDIRLVQAFQHEIAAWYYTLAWFDAKGVPQFLNPDICGDYYRFGKFYLDSTELLRNRTPAMNDQGASKGFHVPGPADGFVYYLIKKIDKQDLSAEHAAYLASEWRKDPQGSANNIRRFWDEADVKLLSDAAQTNQWDNARARLPELQKNLRDRRPFCAKAGAMEFGRKLRRAFCPSGLMVAVMGPDGCGKSSVIEHVALSLAPAFRRSQKMHLRPHLGKQTQAGGPVTNPHGKEPYGWFLSLVKLFYLWFDYTAGYFWRVYRAIARSTLVLFDRYYHDLLVDPRRYRFGGSRSLARVMGKLIPHPDLWIVLDAPAEMIHQRKQEVSLDETARQITAYRALAKDLPNAVVVDASQPLNKVVSQVNIAIIDLLANRLRRRLLP